MGKKIKKYSGEDGQDLVSLAALARGKLPDSGPPPVLLDEMTGRPKAVPMDVSQLRDDFRVNPRFLSLGKDNQAVGARFSGTKKLGRDTALQGYLDVDATNDKYNGLRGRGTGAGVTLMHNFAKGGTASSRADGCCVKGKTKGKMI
jgi:hypothetical protein